MRGSAALIRRSRNSYIRSPRNVTFAPIAWSLRNLKFEILFFEHSHVGNMNRSFAFSDFSARVILGLPQVLLNYTHPFNQHPLLLRQDLQNFPARTPKVARDYFDVVALFNVKLDPVHTAG